MVILREKTRIQHKKLFAVHIKFESQEIKWYLNLILTINLWQTAHSG